MKEVRLSIPVIGGITVIYTQDDITNMKQKTKAKLEHARQFTCSSIATACRFMSSNINVLANKLQPKEVK